MPTTSPPDGPEVFTGETLEEAMAEAVAAHGPDLVVQHARRVRSGVRGLLGKERYEVVLAPPTAPSAAAGSGSGDPVEAALAALLEDADAQESAEPVRTSRPRTPAPPRRSEPAVADVRPVRPAAAPARGATPPSPRPAPAPARVRSPEPAPRRPSVPPVEPPAPTGRPRVPQVVLEGAVLPPAVRSAPASAAARPVRPAPRKPRRAAHPDPSVAEHTTLASPSWSRASLKRLGVPARVLSELPDRDPVDDLAWLVALTGAIGACVPPPGRPSAETPAVVDGHEIAGAVAILDLCSRGAVPGTLTTAGRTVPATATELALLVRSHVVGG